MRPAISLGEFEADEESGGRHDEAAWARRLPGMLRFLFDVPEASR